jgi:hypothetical protein
MKKGLLIGLLIGMGLLTTMAVNLTETPKQEVGYFDDVVTAKGPVVNVLAYGAKGDGITDDTTAIQAAINACPSGGTVFLPNGIYRVTQTLVKTNTSIPWFLRGVGLASVIAPDLDANTDCLVFGRDNAGLSGSGGRDFVIASAGANKCRNAIAVKRVYDGYLEDVTIACGHAGSAISLQGATIFRVNRCIIGTLGTGVAYNSTDGYRGITMEDNSVQCNNLFVDNILINHMTDYGFYATLSLTANNIRLSGCIQNCGGGMYVSGMALVDVSNLYFELAGDNYFINSSSVDFRQAKHYGSGVTTYLQNVDGARISQSWLRNVNVDINCVDVDFDQDTFYGSVAGAGAPFVTYGKGENRNSTGEVSNPTGLYGQTSTEHPVNFWTNSSFNQWGATAPTGWSTPANVSWVHCGQGQADTNNLYTPNCAQVTFAAYTSTTYTMPEAARFLAEAKATGWGSYSFWVRTKTVTNGQYAFVRLRVVDATGNHDYSSSYNDANDVWQLRGKSFPVSSTATSIAIQIYGNGVFYIANPTIGLSKMGSRTWTPESTKLSSEKLLASGVALMQNGDAKTTIYTVPTGFSAIVTKVIVRNPSGSLAGGSDFDLGDGANADTWKTTVDLSTMTATTDCIVVTNDNVKYTVFNAGDAFGIKPATGATADVTATVMVYGIEY